MESLYLGTIELKILGAFIAILLAIITMFLGRLLKQFDALTKQVGKLGETLLKIDKDLSNEVHILKEKSTHLSSRVSELDPVWERLRSLETSVTALESGGCSFHTVCTKGH